MYGLGNSIQVNGPYIFMGLRRYTKTSARKGNSALTSFEKKLRKQNSIFCPELLSCSIEIYYSKKCSSLSLSLSRLFFFLFRFQSKSKLDLKTVWHLPSHLHILHIIIFSNFPNLGWPLRRNKNIFAFIIYQTCRNASFNLKEKLF